MISQTNHDCIELNEEIKTLIAILYIHAEIRKYGIGS